MLDCVFLRWLIGWLDQQCIYLGLIRLKLLWTTNPIVACNHTCWRQLNVLCQDGGVSSALLRCFIQDHNNGNWGYIYFFEKRCFKDGFLPWKAAKCHLKVEVANVFFAALWSFIVWIYCQITSFPANSLSCFMLRHCELSLRELKLWFCWIGRKSLGVEVFVYSLLSYFFC